MSLIIFYLIYWGTVCIKQSVNVLIFFFYFWPVEVVSHENSLQPISEFSESYWFRKKLEIYNEALS